MKLEAVQVWYTGKERLNLQPNRGEVLLGYQWIAPFHDGMDREGFTREENGPSILDRLNSIEKHRYLQSLNRKDNKPVPPAMLVPVYLCRKNTSGNTDFNEWIIRTFRVEFTEVYEKKHWWSEPTLVIKDYLRLCPDISCYMMPEDSDPEPVIKHWENLDKKSVTLEKLKMMLGLHPKTETA